jgi:hypothetical protein
MEREEMNIEETKESIRVMQAFVDGKEVEYLGKKWNPRGLLLSDWCDAHEPFWNFEHYDYRIKPTPVFRPWTADEVPLGCILKTKSTNSVWLLIGRNNVGEILIAGDKYQPPEWLLREYEHSTDGGVTWKPCGVVEEAK